MLLTVVAVIKWPPFKNSAGLLLADFIYYKQGYPALLLEINTSYV